MEVWESCRCKWGIGKVELAMFITSLKQGRKLTKMVHHAIAAKVYFSGQQQKRHPGWQSLNIYLQMKLDIRGLPSEEPRGTMPFMTTTVALIIKAQE